MPIRLQSTIDRPLSVRRVRPPSITILNTSPLLPSNRFVTKIFTDVVSDLCTGMPWEQVSYADYRRERESHCQFSACCNEYMDAADNCGVYLCAFKVNSKTKNRRVVDAAENAIPRLVQV